MSREYSDIYYWLALSSVPGMGAVRFKQLVKAIGDPQNVLKAPQNDLEQIDGVSQSLARAINKEADYDFAEKQIDLLQKGGYQFTTYLSDDYPEKLKNIYDPPAFLFYDGDLECLKSPCLAIVGSRNLSDYGRAMAERMARELVQAGFTVVSGFARGIDTAAHRAAIESGGLTAAIFGCGLDIVYPFENKALYKNLILNGCAISEFPFGEKPDRYHFPRRNRIISGLSLGVLIVEAADKSGALLTADHALEQGREVFAVPGSVVSKTSAGTNKIIKQGAKLVTCVEDILEELKFLVPKQKKQPRPVLKIDLPEEQKKIYEVLTDEPLQVDRIVKDSGVPVSRALELLLDLELNGLIRQLSGKMFVKQF